MAPFGQMAGWRTTADHWGPPRTKRYAIVVEYWGILGNAASRYNMQDRINPAVLTIWSSGNLATASNLPNAFESSAILLSFL